MFPRVGGNIILIAADIDKLSKYHDLRCQVDHLYGQRPAICTGQSYLPAWPFDVILKLIVHIVDNLNLISAKN